MNMQGGSFWSAFGVPFSSMGSTLDALLAKDGVTLEEVLDEDDVIQELKYSNTSLIQFLVQPEHLTKLVAYVVMDPSSQPSPTDSTDRKEQLKYPYVASELFACECLELLDSLVHQPGLLDTLFSVVRRPAPLDPAAVGYFRKVVVVLIQKSYDALVQYLKTQPGIIGQFIQHIGLYSMMELLIMIGWDEAMGQINDLQWLYKEDCIIKLVDKLAPEYGSDPTTHHNAGRAIVDVVVKCPSGQSNVLLSQLQSKPVMDSIFKHLASGSSTALSNCLSIITVLTQKEAQRRIAYRMQMGDHPDASAWAASPVLDMVAQRVPFFTSLLHTSAGRPCAERKTQWGVLRPPFGEIRIKTVELFVVLLRTGHEDALANMMKHQVLSLILDQFLTYKWNNMLHALVESIFQAALDSESDALKAHVFESVKLVDRLLDAYAEDVRASQQTGGAALAGRAGIGHRSGFMGHLLRMCNLLAQMRDTVLQPYLAGNVRWTRFVAHELTKENQLQQTVLGGHRPASSLDEESDDEAFDYGFGNADLKDTSLEQVNHDEEAERDAAKLAALMQNFAAEFQDVDNWDTQADDGHQWSNHNGLLDSDEDEDEDGEEFVVYQASKGLGSSSDDEEHEDEDQEHEERGQDATRPRNSFDVAQDGLDVDVGVNSVVSTGDVHVGHQHQGSRGEDVGAALDLDPEFNDVHFWRSSYLPQELDELD